MEHDFASLKLQRLMPLASPENAEQSDALLKGLTAAGITAVEIALRNDYAMKALQKISISREILVGAGTVLTARQAATAAQAGAQFLVSPGLSPAVVREARTLGIPVLPGVQTASDVMLARDLGLRYLKLFPAARAGGIDLLRDFGNVFADVSFMPSGGVTESNLAQHLAEPSVFAASGSWMTGRPQLAEGAKAVEHLARRALKIVGTPQ